ncbi:hypothetical protein [Azoarcus sp. DN11]|uniref:hypothetical protein n=1 Tax=Azoarcus sp. DN11 TaxID=356837 RepID=UPI000EF2E1F1|nr:hypothetical protein [Azoarcus sp. DN11]AYH43792.1 hypothetical protein CDA09_23090 [Azoarcus sp. DN11]
MQSLFAWFNDPIVQSVIISPLVGAILGVLFAGLNSPPSSAAPATVQQTVVIFKQTIIVKQSGGRSSSDDDGWVYLFAFFAVTAGITWGYSKYANEILSYWLIGLFSCSAFILSAGAASAMRGQYSNSEWAWYIFAPIVAAGFSFYLAHLAQVAIIPGAREAAFRYGFIDFYFKALKDEHRMWLLFQIAGVFLGIFATIAAALRSIHYLALMNQRANGGLSSVWRFITRATLFSARTEGVVLLLFAAVISYFMLSGGAYELWQNKG